MATYPMPSWGLEREGLKWLHNSNYSTKWGGFAWLHDTSSIGVLKAGKPSIVLRHLGAKNVRYV